jgi:hypothetical protein
MASSNQMAEHQLTTGILHRVRVAMDLHGVVFPAVLIHRLWVVAYRRAFGAKTFVMGGNEYPYFHHPFTFNSDRTVEIPLGRSFLQEAKPGARILEVGNVLSNFFPITHEVLDKYEKGSRPGLIQADIVGFKPDRGYDRIISISTLEHVGVDEEKYEPEKVVAALRSMKDALAPGGIMMFTAPLGYSRCLDDCVRADRAKCQRYFFLKRISADNRWTEYDGSGPWLHGSPYPHGNTLFVGYYTK